MRDRLGLRPGRRGRLVAGLLTVALLAVVAGTAVALTGDDAAVDAVSETPGEVRGRPEPGQGPTTLDVSVFTPDATVPGADADERRPAVLLAHGFGGSKDDLADSARRMAGAGYVAMTWTARGFGGSGGRIHLDDPAWEIDDVSRLVDALAARDDVRLDGDGDPVVGIAGASYGGGAALLGAAYDDRIDAAVPAITWSDLEQALFPQSASPVPYGDRPTGVFKQQWASLLYGAGLGTGPAGAGGSAPADDGATGDAGVPVDPLGEIPDGADEAVDELLCGRFAPAVCRLYRGAATGQGLTTDGRRLLARSSLTPAAVRGYTAPTLLVQGTRDSLFGLEQSIRTASLLRDEGVEVDVRWFEGGHDAGGLTGVGDGGDLVEPALDWFGTHLGDDAPPAGGQDGGEVELTLPPPQLREDEVEQRATDLDELLDPATTEVKLLGDPQPVVSPPGGRPAALTSLPGLSAGLDLAGGLGQGYALAALPGATAVFESRPQAETLTVVGAPTVDLTVRSTASDATLFASLWLVGEDGTASLPRLLVSPLAVPTSEDLVRVQLPASTYRVEPGQSLRLVVASTDQAYAVPSDPRAYTVALAGDENLTLPTPRTTAVVSAGGLVPQPLLVTVGLLLLAAVALAAWGAARARSRADSDPDPASADVPLVVDGLVKEYSNGFRAVDGVSWRAERGQVVGLLGPNGAGKTTTMRMLVGLISADAGTVRVLGREVGAGSRVLGEVGALIEGPGFLPHLTGRQNVEAYWEATGRPRADANLDEVLAVADLGGAVDRPVRSYSHGMEQRLGIAQAMLGTPDLLLLDEPTNGLDPPQIRGLRGVLRRYAEGGRTVVVSSHLLGEVEQTCSHVVVMHRGRVVLSGAVEDLVQATGSTLVTLEGGDPVGAARLLSGLTGVESAEAVGSDQVRVEGPVRRPRLVEALVREGYAVAGLDGRRQLEEVFMGLVGGGEPAQLPASGAGGSDAGAAR